MESFLFGILMTLVVVGLGWLAFRRTKRGRLPAEHVPQTQSFVTSLRSVGELSVFRARTKEIITSSDHDFGEFGGRYLTWLITNKKMTMIFEFDVDFRYNLLDPELEVRHESDGSFTVKLPACAYEVRIIDMRVHSEDHTKLLPWLMPDLVGRFFTGGGFSVDKKNQLIADAKRSATHFAEGLVAAAQSDAQDSARKTLEGVARSFGADRIQIQFTPTSEFKPSVDASSLERIAPPPGSGAL